jgi:Viral BACON domain
MSSEAKPGEIEGYASATSVAHGEAIRIYVTTVSATYTVNIYRLGWYGGAGGRHVAGPFHRTGIRQRIPNPDPVTGFLECDWTDPLALTVPNDWVTGVYLAKLTADDLRRDKYVLFVVRDDARDSLHNFQLSVTTSQAYNPWGGRSLYPHNSNGPAADVVSFNRPYTDGSGTGNFLWRWEYNMVRFLEREGYDVAYTTNVDTHRDAAQLRRHADLLSVGHDEYWTYEMRRNVEQAIAAGVHIGFFSANTAYWQMRFEPSRVNGEPYRTMVSYKEDAMQRDPFANDNNYANDLLITTKFREAPVSRPEAMMIGVQYVYDPVDDDIVIDDVTSAPWVFEETNLGPGSRLPGLLGYEVDAIAESSPRGIVRLGHSPFVNAKSGGFGYSDMTVYTAPSGATVFATGTIQWSWGLDDWRGTDRPARANEGAQQITRNVLRRFAGARAAEDCHFAFATRTVSMSAAGGSMPVAMQTQSHCPWSLSKQADWVRLDSPMQGQGKTTHALVIEPNPGPARETRVAAGNSVLTVKQESGCSFNVSPKNASFKPDGGSGSIRVETNTASCLWSASTKASWIRIHAGEGTGTQPVTYTVSRNSSAISRDAQILVNGLRFNVHQSKGDGKSSKKRRSSR